MAESVRILAIPPLVGERVANTGPKLMGIASPQTPQTPHDRSSRVNSRTAPIDKLICASLSKLVGFPLVPLTNRPTLPALTPHPCRHHSQRYYSTLSSPTPSPTDRNPSSATVGPV